MDVRRIAPPGFPVDMLYPSLRTSPGRFTCQLQDEWDVAMLCRLLLHGPRVPEEIAAARFVGPSARPDDREEQTVWGAGPTLRRCKSNKVEAALGMALLPSDDRLDALEWSGRIFGIMDGYAMLYPAFQFDTAGRVLAIFGRIRDEMHRVHPRPSNLSLAQWLIAHTQTLNGACPLELVHRQPDAVIDALRTDLLRRRGASPRSGAPVTVINRDHL